MVYFSNSLSLTLSHHAQFKMTCLLIPKTQLDKSSFSYGGNVTQRTTEANSTATRFSTYLLPTNGVGLTKVQYFISKIDLHDATGNDI